MRCIQARPLFSSYLDGAVSGAEMHEISEHLDQCDACHEEYGLLEKTRILVSGLGSEQAPPDLAVRIRITLDGERARSWRRILGGQVPRWQHAFHSFMLPAAGGVIVAICFFAALIGFLAPPQVDAYDDVPTMLYTPPRLESSASIDELDLDSPLMIETYVDATGRVQNYRIISGRDDALTHEQLNRTLLFTIFAPAQAFGRPVPGKVVISFSHIHVKG
ncbi:MAG TPA: zf-HC2 domain-containing protein [Candidatus Angelobacter sp.]